MRKEPIIKTAFSDEFGDFQTDNIFLLSKEESNKVWSKYIDVKASSYYKLDDNNWVIRSNRQIIGKWIEDFNQDRIENVGSILNESFFWKDDDIVWFCISKALIIETSWHKFKKKWINFIQCEDDCPIIINSNIKRCALIFSPIGDFLKIEEA